MQFKLLHNDVIWCNNFDVRLFFATVQLLFCSERHLVVCFFTCKMWHGCLNWAEHAYGTSTLAILPNLPISCDTILMWIEQYGRGDGIWYQNNGYTSLKLPGFFPAFFYTKESSIDPLGWNRLARVHISIGMNFNIDTHKHTLASAHICHSTWLCFISQFQWVLLASNKCCTIQIRIFETMKFRA